MNNQLKLSLFLRIAILFFLLGSSLILWTGGEAGIQSSKRAEATEFFYLPLVTNFPPIWFLKIPESPVYLQNYANNAGCNWAGIAGEVFDPQENPVSSGEYRVHTWGSGIDIRVSVGSAPAYGPSGYEVYLSDSPVVNNYSLQLETADGRTVSPIYEVQTRATCYENLLYFVFIQNN
jgi:hypothetical protein